MKEKSRPKNQRMRERTFASLTDALLIVDPSATKILDCNQAAADLFGYSPDKLSGRKADLLYVEKNWSADLQAALKAATRGKGRLPLLEFEMKRSDGTIFPAEHNLSLLEDEFGRPLGWVSLVRDMASRKQIEEILREGEARYRLLAENANDVIWAVNMKGELTYINPSGTRMLGFTFEEAKARTMAEAFTPASYQKILSKFAKAVQQEQEGSADPTQTRILEIDLYHKNGTIIPAEGSFAFLRDAQGRPAGVLGIVRDITERKRVEAALRSSEEKFAKIFKTSPDSVTIIRVADGTFLDVNESFTRVTGYSREEVVGQSYFSGNPAIWLQPGDRVRLVAALKKGGEVQGFETWFWGKDGRVICGLVSARTLEIDGEQCVVGIVNDITEQKRIEEALKKSQENLRALSASIQSVREEERVSIAREIHDDLGQLLTGLKLDLSWFLGQLRADQASLKEKARVMNQLIDQTIGTVRRISTELRPRVLDDFGLIAALEWQAQEFANKTGIVCRFRSSVKKLDLKDDLSIAVFRIFQEALTNVARHSQATRVNASLKKDIPQLILAIADNGRGISEEEISRSNSLGLLGMRERALIFGGTIEIKGKKGKGTGVTLKVPLAK